MNLELPLGLFCHAVRLLAEHLSCSVFLLVSSCRTASPRVVFKDKVLHQVTCSFPVSNFTHFCLQSKELLGGDL